MKIAITFFLLLAISFAQNTTHERDDGHRLLKDCGPLVKEMDDSALAAKSDYFANGRCLGFIQGFLDGFEAMAMSSASSFAHYQIIRDSIMCLPTGNTIGQDVRILVKWLTDHPELLQESASVLTLRAFSEAHPCKATATKPTSTKK